VVLQYLYGLPTLSSLGSRPAITVHVKFAGKMCGWLDITCYDESAIKINIEGADGFFPYSEILIIAIHIISWLHCVPLSSMWFQSVLLFTNQQCSSAGFAQEIILILYMQI
jgi:hypothetical protein